MKKVVLSLLVVGFLVSEAEPILAAGVSIEPQLGKSDSMLALNITPGENKKSVYSDKDNRGFYVSSQSGYGLSGGIPNQVSHVPGAF